MPKEGLGDDGSFEGMLDVYLGLLASSSIAGGRAYVL